MDSLGRPPNLFLGAYLRVPYLGFSSSTDDLEDPGVIGNGLEESEDSLVEDGPGTRASSGERVSDEDLEERSQARPSGSTTTSTPSVGRPD